MDQLSVLTSLCVIFSSSLLVSSQTNNVNIVNNSPVYAKIGSNLTLLCQYTLMSGGVVQDIEWFKDDVKFFKQSWYSSATLQEIKWYNKYATDTPGVSKKGAFLGNAKNGPDGPDGNAGMVIMNMDNDDKGKYRCEIEVEASGIPYLASDEVVVEMNIVPEVPTVTFEPDKTDLVDGDTMVMTCTGNVGSPPGMLSWKRKSRVMWDIQGKLQEQFKIIENKTDGSQVGRIVFNHTFFTSNNDDGAVFRCDASRQSMSQEILSSATRTFKVKDTKPVTNDNINAKSTDMESKQDKSNFEAGANIQLFCDVSSYPTADIKWMKGGETVGDKPLFTIEKAKPTDSGTYTCVATNYINGTKHEGRRDVKVTITEGQSNGLIVGVSVGGFLLALAVVIVVWVIKRRPCPTFMNNRGSAYTGSGNKNSASTVHYKAGADDVGPSNGNHNNPDLLVNNHLVDRQGFKNVANRAFEPEETLDDDVREFLERLGFERYVPIFQRELITSNILAKLTLEDLTGTLGIPLGPSKRMMEKIADMAPYEEAEFQRTNQGDYTRLRDPGYHQLDRSQAGQQGMYSSIQPPLYQRLSNPGDTARAEYSILDQPVYQKTDRQDDHGPHYQPLDYGQYYDDGSSTINRNTGETHDRRQPGQENLDA